MNNSILKTRDSESRASQLEWGYQYCYLGAPLCKGTARTLGKRKPIALQQCCYPMSVDLGWETSQMSMPSWDAIWNGSALVLTLVRTLTACQCRWVENSAHVMVGWQSPWVRNPPHI
eukprot:3392347-Amphidinium_carterae.1